MKRSVVDKQYDLTGNSVVRVFSQQMRSRFIPMGNFRGGAGFRCLTILFILHYFGRPLFQLLIRFERELSYIYKLKEKITGKKHDQQ